MAIICPKCNADNPDTSRFCADCGTQIVSIKDTSVTKTIQEPIVSSGKIIAGKYKIQDELGRGGMGVVYKAKDTKLERTVALKFLPTELTQDKEAKRRFIQEAQAAAALEHPNICTVFEVDEADGQTFISISYIEGQSLKDKLKDRALDVDEAKDIALQVADGLKEAHDKGIVHRDIKPANIMLTKKGQAKITDFGLAKLSWGADLTKPSTIMGTVAYMSPEQAKGEEVDHRTDIWSLGAMLYEMLTNQRPFKKDKEHALIHAILNEKPEPLSTMRRDIPRAIEQAVLKALEKEPTRRYQNIAEFLNDIKTVEETGVNVPKKDKSIIVLPFEDMSPGKDNEYFSDGLIEEIIADLSHIHDLIVISRSSAMTFKGTKKTIPEIAQAVNVRYVLEGSVRKSGDNIRITAQLINARDDVHLWAEKYSGTLGDIFTIQENVSRSIVDALKIRLSLDEEQKVSEKPIDNVQAYECYLKANYEIWRFTEESLSRAIQLLQEGMDIVGENELLSATMGMAYFQYVNAGFKADEEYLDKAELYAHKAFKMNPDSAHGYVLMGMINETRGKFYDAVNDTRKALEINSNDPMALLLLGFLYAIAGKINAAKPLNERLMKIDPLNPINPWISWWINISEGQFSIAAEIVKEMHERDSSNQPLQLSCAWSLVMDKRHKEAFNLIDNLVKDAPLSINSSLGLFMKHAVKGKREQAIQSLSEEAVKLAKIDHIYSWFAAQFYSLLDMKEEALDYLENAVNRGRIDYTFFTKRDPLLKNIRGEPRFERLMKRVKHEWENFEV